MSKPLLKEFCKHKSWCNTQKRLPFSPTAREAMIAKGCDCGLDEILVQVKEIVASVRGVLLDSEPDGTGDQVVGGTTYRRLREAYETASMGIHDA